MPLDPKEPQRLNEGRRSARDPDAQPPKKIAVRVVNPRPLTPDKRVGAKHPERARCRRRRGFKAQARLSSANLRCNKDLPLEAWSASFLEPPPYEI
jgi:hypothetical protein